MQRSVAELDDAARDCKPLAEAPVRGALPGRLAERLEQVWQFGASPCATGLALAAIFAATAS